jgi:hypothetical protein
MGLTKFQVKIQGLSPLVMHNGRLANAADPLVREIKKLTSIKANKRTEQQDLDLIRMEWEGGLYLGDNGAPCIMGTNIESFMQNAAAKTPGPTKPMFQAGLFCLMDPPLEYDGPKTAKGLWAKGETYILTAGVRVNGKSRIMRTRPVFPSWALSFTLEVDTSVVKSLDYIAEALKVGGMYVGLGDWRPRYGRFAVKECVQI